MLSGLWLAFSVFQAAAATNGVPTYTVRTWQTDDGLPQNQVGAIAQTRDGYIWVGTRQGLARFDGMRFTVVEESRAPELKHGSITALCASRDGSLWIACDGKGVTRLKEGAFLHLSEANGLPSNQPHCLLEGNDGSMWIGTEGGLTRFKEGKLVNYTVQQRLGDNPVRALYEDHQGVLRIATRRGLSSLSKGDRITTLHLGTNWHANALSCVREDRQGQLWAGSAEGLHFVRGKKRLTYGGNEGMPHAIVSAVFEDHAGQIWVGTYGGLARIVDSKVVPQSESESAYGDVIYTIFEDQEENLWVGARDGLLRLTPARFTTYTAQEGLSGNNVMSVCEDQAGTIWLGIWEGGLNALRGPKISHYGAPQGQARDPVLALHEGHDGTLWMGMDLGLGLNRLRAGRRTAFPETNGVFRAAIRVIHEDRRGAIWIGTSSGLNVYRAGRFEAYTTANGLAGDTVWALTEDAEGNIWIGTDGGLSLWKGGQFKNFTTREGLTDNTINAIYEDREHTLWLGTKEGGLNRYKEGRFTAYTTRQGLFSDEVYEILEDDFGYFWMSCRQGIFKVKRKELDDFDRKAVKKLSCTAFGKADGLLSVQCNGVAKPAGWKTRDGRLWFPTIRGVVAVECRIKTNERPPPVVIEEVLADKKRLRYGTSAAQSTNVLTSIPVFDQRVLTIPPGRGEVEIHYTALSFQAPEKNRFRYRLEGANLEWVDAGGQRVARYNNLAPGSYRFQVIACNNDGVWNEQGATLALVLQPHFWETWWFKGVLLAGAGLVLTLLYRVRVARLRAIERLRVQIAANLHDDVGARLTKVAMITEFVERETPDTDPGKKHIQAIASTTRDIIQAMDEIVWTINPKNDTLDNLANYIFQYAQEYFQNTGVSCRLDVPAQLPDWAMTTETRHNLFMAVKEALNNALKHAGATEVRVGLGVADGRMRITIEDDGRGFWVREAQGKGNGLENMHQRLVQVGGRLDVESEPGKGTRVVMELKGG